MKLPHFPRGGRLVICNLAFVTMIAQSFAAPEIPRGSLSVDGTLIRVGSPSQLAWQIQYPNHINDVVEVVTPHVLKPKQDMQIRARVLGSSFQLTKNNNGHGNNTDGVDSSNPGNAPKIDSSPGIDDEKSGAVSDPSALDLPVELVWSKNGSEWSRIFYGTQSTVVPTAIVLNTNVASGDAINFGGRGYRNEWLPLYSTDLSTPNLVILKNGDPAPAFISAFRMGQIKGYLKPYFSSDGKTLKLGERDFIILMELDQANPSSAGFDLQDLAVLVTFE